MYYSQNKLTLKSEVFMLAHYGKVGFEYNLQYLEESDFRHFLQQYFDTVVRKPLCVQQQIIFLLEPSLCPIVKYTNKNHSIQL